MNNSKFNLENILVSIVGHLAVAAILVTSFSILGMPAIKIVAPDRIQIMEIDLSRVQISKEETNLKNTDETNEKPKPTEQSDKPATITDKPKPKPAPPKKTTIRVNRETSALNRTMTVSVSDALRVAMTRCWHFDPSRPGVQDIRAVAHLDMNPNGMVKNLRFESASRADEDAAFAYVLETIRLAIGACQPFRMLPANDFESWKKIRLTFYPSTGAVQ
ncbi:MAG: hypothetical protein FWG39_03340 [Alphaproteobacteria bacterium]|nr:hypothetical protein [Alphaproteobacteria bacterium]